MGKLLLAVAMVALLSAPAMARGWNATLGVDQEVTEYVFVGGLYDNDYGFSMAFGVAKQITGPLWSLTRGVIGEPGAALEPDFAMFAHKDGWRIGAIAGPNVDWIGSETPVAVATGAAGVLGGYVSNRTNRGVIVGAKYKWAWDGDSPYKDGWQAFATLVYGF